MASSTLLTATSASNIPALSPAIGINRLSQEDELWLKKYPPRAPMFVRISGIVNPGQYWVRELPMAKQTGNEVPIDTGHHQIFAFETKLGEMYNNAEPKINPANEIKNLKKDMLVAVRPSYRATHWYRGRIISIVHNHQHEIVSNVFLIDYGIVLENIRSKACIRELPRMMTFNKPMAMQVFLAGLRPLTPNLDFQLGMQNTAQEMAPKWSPFSHKFVQDLWSKSKHKLALLRNWRLDLKGRAHGELILLGFTKELHLNKLLVTQGHGAFFANLLRGDLEAKIVKVIGPRFTSICSPGPAPGSRILDESVDFTRLTSEELEQHFASNDELNETSTEMIDERPPPEYDWKPFISEEKLERTIRKNKKRQEFYASRISNSAAWSSANTSFGSNISSSTGIVDLKKPMTKMEWVMARKRLAKQMADDESDMSQPQANNSSASIWDEYRNEEEFIDSDEDEEEREARLKKRAVKIQNAKRCLILPSGVDIGRFIEEALERMPEPIVGPKQIVPELLKNNN